MSLWDLCKDHFETPGYCGIGNNGYPIWATSASLAVFTWVPFVTWLGQFIHLAILKVIGPTRNPVTNAFKFPFGGAFVVSATMIWCLLIYSVLEFSREYAYWSESKFPQSAYITEVVFHYIIDLLSLAYLFVFVASEKFKHGIATTLVKRVVDWTFPVVMVVGAGGVIGTNAINKIPWFKPGDRPHWDNLYMHLPWFQPANLTSPFDKIFSNVYLAAFGLATINSVVTVGLLLSELRGMGKADRAQALKPLIGIAVFVPGIWYLYLLVIHIVGNIRFPDPKQTYESAEHIGIFYPALDTVTAAIRALVFAGSIQLGILLAKRLRAGEEGFMELELAGAKGKTQT